MSFVASFLYDCDRFGDSETIIDADELKKDKHKLLILHGGEDISTSFYGETPWRTSGPYSPSRRDRLELAAFNRAMELHIPVLGICRGAQLVCALLGGSLYQDVMGHNRDHDICIEGSDVKIQTNSCHHQMMILPKEARLLAYHGPKNSSRWKKDRNVTEEIKEPEVAVWDEARVLAVQGHPEWDKSKGGIHSYTVALLEKLFGV
jgi:putative glutamine amidotransferase